MNSAVWKGGSDCWVWLGDKEGSFIVSSVKRSLVYNKDYSKNYVMRWSKWVPTKCNIHGWRAEMKRIPTKDVLEKRNIPVLNKSCILCDSGIESADHIYTGCMVAAVVWENISRWCKVPPIFGFSVRDLLELHKVNYIGANKNEVLHGIIIIACWTIWKARNEKVFEGKDVKIEEIIADIKSFIFFGSNIGQKVEV
ncbi:uncharacterized protein LOC143547568 [Bidens hawaiensis]|uniref:uncharacterized protein LOC143547568 n=1 Tax=Bidens hawaiensis TaxID=980011 RepID=UPI00404B078C